MMRVAPDEHFWMFALRLPPSVNHYYARNRNGGTRVTKKGKAYHTVILQHVLEGMIPRLGAEPVTMHIDFHPRVQGGDIDNYDKCLFDAFTKAGVWHDDRQVITRTTRKRAAVTHGALVIMMRPANQEEIEAANTVNPHVTEIEQRVL